jgi:hypothetical protein
MDFGSWFGPEFAGAKVVTLDEQISCYGAADPTLQFYVETKTQPDQGDRMETRLVDLLRKIAVTRRIQRRRDATAPGRRHQTELARFLLKRHPRDQAVHERWNFQPARCLQERACRACQPGGNGARTHKRGPARNARIEHSLSPSLALCLALRAIAGSESLTWFVTGYMTQQTGKCNRSAGDICPNRRS